MQLAAVLPTSEIGADTSAVRDWVAAAEELGYQRIIAYDHVLGAEHSGRVTPLGGPYTPDDPFREPMTFLAYVAGVTKTVELMPGVLVLPQRQTVLVAKQATEVDLLSDGRLVLGVGIGWNRIEYQSLGLPFERRGARLEEQVALLRLLWTRRVLDFEGAFHRVDRAGIWPLPRREIPLWFGGRSRPAVERAAVLGDGVYFAGVDDGSCASAERLAEIVPVRQPHRDRRFGLAGQINTRAGQDKCIADTRRWASVGGTQIAVNSMRPRAVTADPPMTVDGHIAHLAEFADVVRSAQ